MPVNRSPTASPQPTTSTDDLANLASQRLFSPASTLIQCSSVPDLSSTAERYKKRKLDGLEEGNVAINLNTFSAFTQEQEMRFEDLLLKLNSIFDQNRDLKDSVELMSKKHDEFLNRISVLEGERKEDRKLISQLEEKIESLERKSRSATIEIRNVPKKSDESKQDLANMVINLGKSMDINFEQSNIRDIYRGKSKEDSKPIIVEFASVIMKERVIKGVKHLNSSEKRENKLNTSHLNLNCPVKPVFISETLTFRAQRLYYLARQFKNAHGFLFCWTSHGFIYLRKKVGDPQLRVNCEADLEKLRNAM